MMSPFQGLINFRLPSGSKGAALRLEIPAFQA